MEKTIKEFGEIYNKCIDVFSKKLEDYGPAWRILRPESLTDQIYIKVNRIRSIQIQGEAKINEGITDEFIGIVNYSIIALIQLKKGFADTIDMQNSEALELYKKIFEEAQNLMIKKNHDYGEAWRLMRVSSMTDLILMKIFRIKQIEDNNGKTTVSEGIDANYFDIINYAIFCLIKLLIENNKNEDENEK